MLAGDFMAKQRSHPGSYIRWISITDKFDMIYGGGTVISVHEPENPSEDIGHYLVEQDCFCSAPIYGFECKCKEKFAELETRVAIERDVKVSFIAVSK